MSSCHDRDLVIRALNNDIVKEAVAKAVLDELSRNAPSVKCYPLTDSAWRANHTAGFLHARAVVDVEHMAMGRPKLYSSLLDFENDRNKGLSRNVRRCVHDAKQYRCWLVETGEAVMVGTGIGFSFSDQMEPTLKPHHQLTQSVHVELVDCVDGGDEVVVRITNHSEKPFVLHHNHLIGRLAFRRIIAPRIEWDNSFIRDTA